MDVHADDAGLRPDPHATAVVERPVTDSQGQLFNDGQPTYADTDKIPAYRASPPVRRGPAMWLRILVALVAVVVLAAAAALGLVKAGVIDKSGTGSPPAAPTTHHHAAAASKGPLVSEVTTSATGATYRINIAAYTLTVTTSTGRSWVSIGAVGKKPIFAGVMNPNSSQKELLLGPSEVDVGAGGTKVIVTSGRQTFTLTPPAAPFSYFFPVKT